MAFLFCAPARADFITATLAVTNIPANGATLANGADVRTWTTGSITTPGTQIAIVNCSCAAENINLASNLWNQIQGNKFAFMNATWDLTTSNVIFKGQAPLVLTASAGWCSITYVTNTTPNALLLGVPFSNYDPTNQTNYASGVVAGLSANSTNAFQSNSVAMQQFGALLNAQTWTGANTFTNAGTVVANGAVSNLQWATFKQLSTNVPVISITNAGTAATETNLVISITSSDGTRIFSVDGQGSISNTGLIQCTQLNTGFIFAPDGLNCGSFLTASDIVSTNGISGPGYFINGLQSPPIGPTAFFYGTNGFVGDVFQLFHDYNVTKDFWLTSNGIVNARIFTAAETSNLVTSTGGTNLFNGIVCLPAKSISSLANGNNTVIPGTNSYIQVSGPTGSFSICSLPGGIAGRMLTIENTSGQAMTIANQSGFDGTVANRILTMTGSDRVIANNVVTLWYDGSASRWKVIGVN